MLRYLVLFTAMVYCVIICHVMLLHVILSYPLIRKTLFKEIRSCLRLHVRWSSCGSLFSWVRWTKDTLTPKPRSTQSGRHGDQAHASKRASLHGGRGFGEPRTVLADLGGGGWSLDNGPPLWAGLYCDGRALRGRFLLEVGWRMRDRRFEVDFCFLPFPMPLLWFKKKIKNWNQFLKRH